MVKEKNIFRRFCHGKSRRVKKNRRIFDFHLIHSYKNSILERRILRSSKLLSDCILYENRRENPDCVFARKSFGKKWKGLKKTKENAKQQILLVMQSDKPRESDTDSDS